jgi:hypothetical protein
VVARKNLEQRTISMAGDYTRLHGLRRTIDPAARSCRFLWRSPGGSIKIDDRASDGTFNRCVEGERRGRVVASGSESRSIMALIRSSRRVGFFKRATRVACGLALLFGGSIGCHQFPDVFHEELPDSAMVTTSSAARVVATGREASVRDRGFHAIRLESQEGTVVHGPLYFAQGIEMDGSEDGQFAVTLDDILQWPIGLAQLGADVLLLPFQMVFTPPTTVMCSDGVAGLSRPSGRPQYLDAQRCVGAAIPIDVYEVWMFEASSLDSDDSGDTSDSGDYGDSGDSGDSGEHDEPVETK